MPARSRSHAAEGDRGEEDGEVAVFKSALSVIGSASWLLSC
ncbi:hypothetical protein ACFFX0_26370 [Citricoccus parietis]|uniref:Uncharacterized protein n=1 Tax=Citricoccus parietis TaxID=592307 RepID=A0ABV5G6K1_9MICC